MMIIKKPTGRKYITRMDYPTATGEWVRILDNRVGHGKVSKFFNDSKYETEAETLCEAIKFRDNYFSRLTLAEKQSRNKGQLNQAHDGAGVYISWKKRANGYMFPYVCASWNNNGKQYVKWFSVEKYGYSKAMGLAEQTRKQKTKNKIRV